MNKFKRTLEVLCTVTIEPNKSALIPVNVGYDNDVLLLTLNPFPIKERPIVMSCGSQVHYYDGKSDYDGITYVLIHNTSMSVHLTIDEGTPLVLATTLHKVKDEPKKGSKKEKESIQ